MENFLRQTLAGTLLMGLLVAGCGSGGSDLSAAAPAGAGPLSQRVSDPQAALEQAMLDEPGLATRLAPANHLNPLQLGNPQGNALNLPVGNLESDYETLFCGLSDDRGVTFDTPQVQADIRFISSQPGTGFFNLSNKPILNNPLGIASVNFEKIEYDTTVPLPAGNQSFHVSGGLLLPQGISRAQVKGVLVYFHGTTFSKAQVPSNYQGSIEARLMAQVFASQGYVVVMPDYVGQGIDWQNVHPYVLYPKVSAQTAADMLKAVRARLVAQYAVANGDPPFKLFSTGYSEGGSYSLWFNQYLRTNPGQLDSLYALTHSVGLEGAYSTSKVTFAYLFEEVSKGGGNPFNIQTLALVNLVKPILSADAFLSYATYSVNSDFGSVFNDNFFHMKATFPVPQSDCDVAGQNLNIAQAFALEATNIAPQVLASALSKKANGAIYPGPLELLTSSGNSVRSLVSPTLISPAPLEALLQVLKSADLDLSAVPDQGISIVTLDQDSVVVPNNFDDLQARFPSKIRDAFKVDHTAIQVVSPFSPANKATFVNVDHLHGLIYEFLYALNTFNKF